MSLYFIGEGQEKDGGFDWGDRSEHRLATQSEDFSLYSVVVKTRPEVTEKQTVKYLRDLAEVIEAKSQFESSLKSQLPPENLDDELRRAGLI